MKLRPSDLAAIERNDDARYCEVCSTTVHFVRSSADLDEHVRAGHCIALRSVDGDDWEGPGGMLMGEIAR